MRKGGCSNPAIISADLCAFEPDHLEVRPTHIEFQGRRRIHRAFLACHGAASDDALCVDVLCCEVGVEVRSQTHELSILDVRQARWSSGASSPLSAQHMRSLSF
jgi:hypothetical protein